MPGEGGVGSLGQFRNRRCAMICALKWTGSTAEIEDPPSVCKVSADTLSSACCLLPLASCLCLCLWLCLFATIDVTEYCHGRSQWVHKQSIGVMSSINGSILIFPTHLRQ